MGDEERMGSGGGGEVDVAELLRRLRPRLQTILHRFRIPPDDADDVVQQTLLHFVRKRSKVLAPEAWLCGALRHECRMYWRGRSRRLTVAVDQALLDVMAGGSNEEPERGVLLGNLDRYLDTLTQTCRRLLRMRYTLELDNREVADRTGYQPSSVDKVTKRCLDALGRKMAAASVSRRLLS